MSAANDRAAELHALDATFAGVHGLVASGVMHVPRIFRSVPDDHHQPETREPAVPAPSQETAPAIPVIDLGGDHAAVVAAVRDAAAEWGFFQVTGHCVPLESMAVVAASLRKELGLTTGRG